MNYDALPTKPRKAVAAFTTTLLGGLGAALLDDGAIAQQEAGYAVGLSLVAAAAVWRVRNPVDRAKLGNPPSLMPRFSPGDVERQDDP